MAFIVYSPRMIAFDSNGDPLPGAQLYSYLSGTATPSPLYTDAALTTAASNPALADAGGVFDKLYFDPALNYRLKLDSVANVQVYQEDDVPGSDLSSVGHLFRPRSAAEVSADVIPSNYFYDYGDIRRYGALADFDINTDTDGQVAVNATDNLAAFNSAIAVALDEGGGVIKAKGGGDFYVSNTIDATGIDNLWFYVEPGTTIRTTKYTSSGSVIVLGTSDPADPMTNVGVYGGGTIRSFQPDHATVAAHQTSTSYAVGAYVKATDSNAETRAYYCKTAGTTGSSSPPDVVNGSDTDGTVVWQDADNDNLISISGIAAYVDGMDLPQASGKPITVQRPGWKNVWITRNNIGTTNDKGIEVKGQQGSVGQENYFGDGANIVGNIIGEAGREGIEAEQSTNGVNLNENIRIVGNLVRNAGVINSAAGIRANRCDGLEIRGNKVLDSGGPGFHIRLCKNVTGDLHSESSGASGAHLQENSGYAFDSIYIKSATTVGVNENTDAGGGYVGRLVIDGATDGWDETARAGNAPVIVSYKMSTLSGSEFSGALPTLIGNVPAAKLQAFVLTITNDAGTLKHKFVDDVVNSGASQFADRITAASATATATPTGADSGTAFANGGKISSNNTNEFILNHANAAAAAHGVKLCNIVLNDSDTDLICGFVRRSVDVNGTTLSRWHLSFRQTTDGAAWALNTTNIAASETVSVQCMLYLP